MSDERTSSASLVWRCRDSSLPAPSVLGRDIGPGRAPRENGKANPRPHPTRALLRSVCRCSCFAWVIRTVRRFYRTALAAFTPRPMIARPAVNLSGRVVHLLPVVIPLAVSKIAFPPLIFWRIHHSMLAVERFTQAGAEGWPVCFMAFAHRHLVGTAAQVVCVLECGA